MAVPGLAFAPGYCPLWQEAQPAVIPAWFIFHVANDEVLVWQASHAADVAMCTTGLPSTPGTVPL